MSNSITAGPLGSVDNQAIGGPENGLLAYGNKPIPVGAGKTPPAAKPQAPAGQGTTELKIAQSCPQPAVWQNNAVAEKAAAFGKPSTWAPTSPDFLAVGGTGTKSNATVAGFLSLIMGSPGLIRLDYFGHGNADNCPMASFLDSNLEVFLSGSEDLTSSGLDDKALVQPFSTIWGIHGEQSATKNAQGFTLDDIRAKFSPGAVIWLYLCHSAANPSLVQQLANTFQCTVNGFQNEINYCTPSNFPQSRKHRLEVANLVDPLNQLGITSPCTAAVTGFKDLDTNAMVVSKSPLKP